MTNPPTPEISMCALPAQALHLSGATLIRAAYLTLVFCFASAFPSHAQTFTTLASFNSTNGSAPGQVLIQGSMEIFTGQRSTAELTGAARSSRLPRPASSPRYIASVRSSTVLTVNSHWEACCWPMTEACTEPQTKAEPQAREAFSSSHEER